MATRSDVSAGHLAENGTLFLVLLLLATVGVHIWPEALPWRAQTLHRDLPYAGLWFAMLALILLPIGRLRGLSDPPDAIRLAGRVGWGVLASAIALLTLLVALPTAVAVSWAGLAVQRGQQWGVPGAPIDPHPVRRLDLRMGPGGVWGPESFSSVMSGWLYVPVEGMYHIALDVDADGMIEIDGLAVVGRGAPGGLAPPGVTDAATGFRRARVYLQTGFHLIQVLSRHQAESARLRVRWTPPWLSQAITIPTDHLLPTGATPRDIWLRSLLLAGRRVGVLGLACLGFGMLAVVLTGVRKRVGQETTVRVGRAHLAGVALLFFMLTGTPLLMWTDHARILAPLLAGAWGVGALATAALVLFRARRPDTTAASGWSGWTKRGGRVWPMLALAVVQATLCARFLVFVDGRILMPGDHSSFLYRYHTLLHTLPRLRFYDPWWNAGAVDQSPALSGATAVLALSWPVLTIGNFPDVYPMFILVVGVLLAPWSLYATMRLLGGSRLAALLAGLLALAPGDVYFWWFMAHGTLPNIVSSALAPLVIALAWRVFGQRDHRWHLVLSLFATLLIGFCWVGFVMMVGPALGVGAVVGWRRLRRRDLMLATALVAGVLVIHAHWLVGLLWLPDLPHMELSGESTMTVRTYLRDLLAPMLFDPNPIALVLGGVGTFLLPGQLRRVYGGFILSLLGVATLLHPVFSRLELDRFLVPFGIALIPPAAWVAARLLRAARSGLSSNLSFLVGVGLFAVLLLHVDGAWRQYSGQLRRTARQVEFLSEPTEELVRWIRSSTSPNGRIFVWGDLPGPSRLEGGYKAFLQPLTERPMIGYHVNAKWVDMRVSRIVQTADIHAALEALNVRHVIVTDDRLDLQSRLARTAGLQFRQALSRFAIYDVDINPSYVLGAKGTVLFDYDRLDVRLEDAVDVVTLKFRWVRGLVSDPPLPLDPVEILPGIPFIRVRTAGTRTFRIRYTDCCAWHPAEIWARWRDARP